MTFRCGLVVGKFAPLHRGHELVVARAARECDDVLVLSYTRPEFPRCEPAARKRWLARAFPRARCVVVADDWLAHRTGAALRVPPNDAPDVVQRDFVASLCLDVLGTAPDAVFTSEDYGPGFAAVLTRRFRERDQSHPGVAHVLVDRDRRAVPISATAIRADPHAHRRLLAPHVYAAFVDRVALVGGESSGKSTLALALAEHFGTVSVSEYGRDYWVERGGVLTFDDYLQIAETQVAREEAAVERALRYVFCDSTPATTLFYCRDAFGRADARLEALAARPYALHVLCAPDIPFDQDGTRRDAAFRMQQHDYYVERLARSGGPWLLVEGSVGERVAAVAERLDSAR